MHISGLHCGVCITFTYVSATVGSLPRHHYRGPLMRCYAPSCISPGPRRPTLSYPSHSVPHYLSWIWNYASSRLLLLEPPNTQHHVLCVCGICTCLRGVCTRSCRCEFTRVLGWCLLASSKSLHLLFRVKVPHQTRSSGLPMKSTHPSSQG